MGDNGVKKTLHYVIGISSIVLVSLVILIIFGNLSGNTGITTTTATTTTNESGFVNKTGYTPSVVDDLGFMSYAISQVWGNYTSGAYLIPASNYSQSANIIYNATGNAINLTEYGYNDAGITYVTTYRSNEYLQTQGVINNVTSGVGKMVSQIPTILLFVGIGLLLFVLIGVLAWVIKKMSNMGGRKNLE